MIFFSVSTLTISTKLFGRKTRSSVNPDGRPTGDKGDPSSSNQQEYESECSILCTNHSPKNHSSERDVVPVADPEGNISMCLLAFTFNTLINFIIILSIHA